MALIAQGIDLITIQFGGDGYFFVLGGDLTDGDLFFLFVQDRIGVDAGSIIFRLFGAGWKTWNKYYKT